MRKSAGILLPALLWAVLLSSCGREGRVIPAGKFSDIYARMFLADQWMIDHTDLRRTADTTQFYEAIFREYGYSFKDYDASVRHYLKKPEKYAKILKRAADKLEEDHKKLVAVQERVIHLKELMRGIGGYETQDFPLDSVFTDSLTFWPVFKADTVAVDSLDIEASESDSSETVSLSLDPTAEAVPPLTSPRVAGVSELPDLKSKSLELEKL